MKPAPFRYVRPESVKEACSILSAEEDARLIAGGQSLVPMLAMRLAQPSVLVDIARIPELAGISQKPGVIAIGATTRQLDAQHSELVEQNLPLLPAALDWVGHVQTRSRGTIGGSIAHADPSAEIPLVSVTLNAQFHFESQSETASIPAREFFVGPMMTAMPDYSCLTRIEFPVWESPHVGVGFLEVSARRSDFAITSAAVQLAIDEVGICRRIAVGIGGVNDAPVSIDVSGLLGTKLDANIVRDVLESALSKLDPMNDAQVSAAYRMRVAPVIAYRAIEEALNDARRKGAGR